MVYCPPNPVVGESLFAQFSIDFVGPFPKSESGNSFILLAVENFTRWPIAIASPDNDALTTARFLYSHIFTHFGPPTHLLSDNGVHFINHMVKEFLAIIKTHHKVSSIYHPQTNGMAEKINGVIVSSLKAMVQENKTQWDTMLPAALYAYRTKVHSTLKISPYEALFGQPPSPPMNDVLFKLGKILGFERLVKLWGLRTMMEMDEAKLMDKIHAIGHFNQFEIGDKVIILDHKRTGKDKLDPKYLPTVYVITKAFRNSFRLISESGVVFPRAVNAKSLKKYRTRIDNQGINIS
jgi:hypothetical protein